MKLAAYYNSWDDWEMLQYSLKNIRPLVDIVFVVFSYRSNYGENRSGQDGSAEQLEPGAPVFFRQLEPNLNLTPSANETAKRNYGLDLCREFNCTHVLCMDSDEFYQPEQFVHYNGFFERLPGLNGIVGDCNVYFKSPTLTAGKDITRVPFIHKLTPTLAHSFNRHYPYAWEKGQIRIDPTRSYNINTTVIYNPDLTMHHYSWIRSDIEKKIRNSTAKSNIERSTIREDYFLATEGSICRYYNHVLRRVPNYFGIDIQTNDDLASNKELLS